MPGLEGKMGLKRSTRILCEREWSRGREEEKP
jgi:hypothetical protein